MPSMLPRAVDIPDFFILCHFDGPQVHTVPAPSRVSTVTAGAPENEGSSTLGFGYDGFLPKTAGRHPNG